MPVALPTQSGVSHILVAEDDDDLRFVIVYLLKRAYPGARIAAYVHGQDALADFDVHGASIVISNHSMPIMDGPTFVKRLRERSDVLPILMVSGSPEAEGEGLEAGISAFLDKDEISARLIPEMEKLLARSLLENPAS